MRDETFGDLRELRAKMVMWAMRLTRGGSDAEDLVQAAMLRMFANRQRAPQVLREVEPWARVILTNVFRIGLRRTRRDFVSLDDIALAAPDNPETAVYCRQVCAILGFDAAMLLADPKENMTPTERSRRRRSRIRIQQVAA